MSNLSSVLKAAEHVAPNDNVIVSSSLKEINDADKIIFPGQGAAKKCMSSINDKNLVGVIKKNSIEKPFLGICMGMQVLMDFSEENNGTECLGIIKGKVRRFHKTKDGMKIPHMGWNRVKKKTDHPIWSGIDDNSYFYFVHSYLIEPENKTSVIGKLNMERKICSVIAKDNIVAIQGHPEKSSVDWLKVFKKFY